MLGHPLTPPRPHTDPYQSRSHDAYKVFGMHNYPIPSTPISRSSEETGSAACFTNTPRSHSGNRITGTHTKPFGPMVVERRSVRRVLRDTGHRPSSCADTGVRFSQA